MCADRKQYRKWNFTHADVGRPSLLMRLLIPQESYPKARNTRTTPSRRTAAPKGSARTALTTISAFIPPDVSSWMVLQYNCKQTNSEWPRIQHRKIDTRSHTNQARHTKQDTPTRHTDPLTPKQLDSAIQESLQSFCI